MGLLRATPSSSFRPGWQLSQILAEKLNSSNHPVVDSFLNSSFVMFYSIGLLPMYEAALLHFMFNDHYSLRFESCIGPPGGPKAASSFPQDPLTEQRPFPRKISRHPRLFVSPLSLAIPSPAEHPKSPIIPRIHSHSNTWHLVLSLCALSLIRACRSKYGDNFAPYFF